jgi:hypothetical protein
MRSKFISLFVMTCGAALSASPVAPANATNINVHAAGCQLISQPALVSNVRADDLVHSLFGVSASIYSAPSIDFQPSRIICAVPRSPLAATATVGAFYVDGDNFKIFFDSSTTCTLYAINYDGVILGGTSFIATEEHYDRYITLPASLLSMWTYTTLECTIPPSGNGRLRGITVLQ